MCISVIALKIYFLNFYHFVCFFSPQDGCREAVAIKVVEKRRLSKSAEDNIVTEISLLKKLKHPHIVNMKDFLYDGR